MNAVSVNSVFQFTTAASPNAKTAQSAADISAVRADRSPRAIGRPAVRGFKRSASASTASLSR